MNNLGNTVAAILSTLGVLFFIAMAFNLMPGNYAIFAGIACMLVAGLAKVILAPKQL